MFFNVPFSDAGHGQKGNYPSPQPSKDSLTLKVRASRILRAYINAPSGQAAEGAFQALATLDPLPTFREAVQLTEKIPAVTQSRALTRFSALLAAQEDRQGCADGGRGHHDPCQCPRKPKERKAGDSDGGKDQSPQKPSQAHTAPNRFRGIFGAHVPAPGADLDRRVGEALAVLRGPGDPDAHIQAIGVILFPEVKDRTERRRRASRFLIRAIITGATSEPFDPNQSMDEEGGAA